MKKLLLFDIDGTLVSVERAASRQLLRDVVRETLEMEIPADYTFQLGGKTDFQIMTEIATDLAIPLSIIDERRDFIKERLVAHTERIASEELVERLAGVRELLDELLKRDDVTLGLLTGNIKQTAYLKLRPHGLSNLFPFGAFGCDHIKRTELPPIAIRRANAHVQPHAGDNSENEADGVFVAHNTMIIGDTLNDIACARAHRIPVLSVASGPVTFERLAEERPEFVVRDFSDTAQILDILLS